MASGRVGCAVMPGLSEHGAAGAPARPPPPLRPTLALQPAACSAAVFEAGVSSSSLSQQRLVLQREDVLRLSSAERGRCTGGLPTRGLAQARQCFSIKNWISHTNRRTDSLIFFFLPFLAVLPRLSACVLTLQTLTRVLIRMNMRCSCEYKAKSRRSSSQ